MTRQRALDIGARFARPPLPPATADADAISAFDAALLDIVHRHLFQYYLAATFPEADKVGLERNLIVSNWPQPLLRNYESTDSFDDSRLIDGLKKTILPISSADLIFAERKDGGLKSELRGMFYDAGFRHTIGFSLFDMHRQHYVVMFSGIRDAVAESELASVLYVTMKALDLYAAAMPDPNMHGTVLTARETECLRWSAAGKSSEEIAVILDLSNHTVNSYLKSAMRKLNSVSRMQAVATACRLRLI